MGKNGRVGEVLEERRNGGGLKSKSKYLYADDEQELEETRCPICCEHPQNAVLLRCSSGKKGCRPYICNTGTGHSNCLSLYYDSFCSKPRPGEPDRKRKATRVTCPMCRGRTYGWTVVEPARRIMDSKPRGCACAGCDFAGSYSQLRQHVRSEHPNARPAEANPQKMREWERKMTEFELMDVLAAGSDQNLMAGLFCFALCSAVQGYRILVLSLLFSLNYSPTIKIDV